MRARLLAGLLAVVVVGGLASGVIQLLLVPGFWPTLAAMLVALAALAAGYGASRTRHYRVGGWVAALAPIAACAAAAVLNPDDRVWYAFMSLAVLLGAVFLPRRSTAAVAGLAFVTILALAAFVPELRSPERLVPPLAFHAIFSPMLLLAAHHRNRLEEAERRRQLLAVARRQPVEPRLVDLGGLLRDSERLLRGALGERVALELRTGDGLWPVRADPGELRRVVLNLAVNARDALPAGGRFTLATADVELDAAAAERRPGLRPGPHVLLTAADDGVGLAPEVVAHAFEPFFTTKPAGAGTGLGLASVWGIVTQAGGHVGVESQPGRGARFEIHLPRAAP
jgi:signal transduction histidine kinase